LKGCLRPVDDLRPLRICLAVPYLAPYTKTNGIAWYNRWLADGLVKRGHAVTVVDSSPVEPQSLPEPWGRSVALRNSGKSALPRTFRTAMLMRKFLGSDGAFDILETSNWPGLAALRPRKAPVTFIRLVTPTGHGGGYFRHSVCYALEAISVHRADAIIASTSYIQRTLSKLYRIDLTGAYRISFGIPDVHVSGSHAERARARTSREGPIRLISIGRAEGRKGSDVLLQALLRVFRLRDDVTVTLVGSYDAFAKTSVELQNVWTELRSAFGERLTLLEDIPEDEKLALLASSDYLLMTSRTESFGLPVIESMRAGTPVISSAGGGLREVSGASPGNILYEDPEDPELLAGAIVAAVDDGRARALERGLAARATYLERFHEDVFLDRTVAAYRDRLEKVHFAQAR
jgi:glycosyltransferase involved in cell wall biosynthesis